MKYLRKNNVTKRKLTKSRIKGGGQCQSGNCINNRANNMPNNMPNNDNDDDADYGNVNFGEENENDTEDAFEDEDADVNDDDANDSYNSNEKWSIREYKQWIKEGSPVNTTVKRLKLRYFIPITPEIKNLSNLEEMYLYELEFDKFMSFPEPICQLKNLRILHIFGLLSSLPDSIGNLTNLEKLNVEHNKLTSLPDSIGNLINLKKLLLSNNTLTGLPDSICDLKNLIVLGLEMNWLASLPNNFGNLTNLTELYLGSNELASLPNNFGNLTKLTELYLDSNNLSSLPESISQLENLDAAHLNSNNFSIFPKVICQITNLNSLYLTHNKLTNIPKEIGNLRGLFILNCSKNKLIELPEEIGNLTRLSFLNLFDNRLSNLPKTINNLVNLRGLFLEENPWTQEIQYTDFPNLRDSCKENLNKLNEKIREEAPIRRNETALALLDARQKPIPYEASSEVNPNSRSSQMPNYIKNLVKPPKINRLPEDIVEKILRDYAGYAPTKTTRLYSNILSQSKENARKAATDKTLLKGGKRSRKRSKKTLRRKTLKRRTNKQ